MVENFGLMFPTPTFLEGVARTLDLSGSLTRHNTALTPEDADFLALRSDWRAVGEDFNAVLIDYTGREEK